MTYAWGEFGWIVFVTYTVPWGQGNQKMMRLLVSVSARLHYDPYLSQRRLPGKVSGQAGAALRGSGRTGVLCLYVVTNVVVQLLVVTSTGVDFHHGPERRGSVYRQCRSFWLIIGPNHATMPDLALFYLSIGMLLGGLDYYGAGAVYVLVLAGLTRVSVPRASCRHQKMASRACRRFSASS